MAERVNRNVEWITDDFGDVVGYQRKPGDKVNIVRLDPVTQQMMAGDTPVSGAGNSAAPTEFPAERVTMAATGCVCASPCELVRIRCVSGAAVALVVYDNPAASSGTQLYSGTLSAGQEAAISTPVRAINGLRAVFASGSFDFYVSQEA